MSETKSAFIAIVGRPNVGKSTLLNTLLGEKISITSPKPQTTRTQILGIKTVGLNQLVFIDTPGIHHTDNRAMNRYMNRLATGAMDADLIVWIVEVTAFKSEDELVLEQLSHCPSPIILVVNKIDLLKNKANLLPFINRLKEKLNFLHIIPLCAKEAAEVTILEQKLVEQLYLSPHHFPDDQVTDKPINFQMAEIIREKLIRLTEEELPYTTVVEIETFKEDDKLIEIGAIIWVEREGQKPIVIGKQGARLKKIGTESRREMEIILAKKVFLRLWVKVKKNWTDNERALINLGYT